MTAPIKPTEEEIQAASLRWEYSFTTQDVSRLEDPPYSQPPLVKHERRIVGE